MQIPEHIRQRTMSAVASKETEALMKGIQQSNKSGLAQQLVSGAVAGVKTVVQEVGWAPLAGGAALYLAKIREADRQARTAPVHHKGKPHMIGRDYER